MGIPLKTRLAQRIDHAVLAPLASLTEMEEACQLARTAGLASVCVKPWMVSRASSILKGSATVASTVIGFPQGGMHPRIKLAEAAQALADGAVELDMVVNLGWVAMESWARISEEIGQIAQLAHRSGGKLKVILETPFSITNKNGNSARWPRKPEPTSSKPQLVIPQQVTPLTTSI